MTNRELENVFLKFSSLEEFLEQFNIPPEEVLVYLYEGGLLDEDILEELRSE